MCNRSGRGSGGPSHRRNSASGERATANIGDGGPLPRLLLALLPPVGDSPDATSRHDVSRREYQPWIRGRNCRSRSSAEGMSRNGIEFDMSSVGCVEPRLCIRRTSHVAFVTCVLGYSDRRVRYSRLQFGCVCAADLIRRLQRRSPARRIDVVSQTAAHQCCQRQADGGGTRRRGRYSEGAGRRWHP
jgi:hypothetical protein